MQIIVNLITKAVTAPFALLGAIVGGHGEARVRQFAPGRADILPSAKRSCRRWPRHLPIVRRSSSTSRGARLPMSIAKDEARRARSRAPCASKSAGGQGRSAPSLDALTIEPAEYPIT